MEVSPTDKINQNNETPQKYRMGEYVEARKDSSQLFRAGQIVAVHKQSGLYDVAFEDKGEALEISTEHIKKKQDPRNDQLLSSPRKEDIQLPELNISSKPSFPYKIGEQVEALRDNKEIWRFAVIAAINEVTQTVDVIYSDHYRESNVPLERIRSFYLGADPMPSATPLNTATEQIQFRIGMPIEARYQGGSLYYPGVIVNVDAAQSAVDILYEDGFSEQNVPKDLVRKRNAQSVAAAKEPVTKFPVGTKVEANYRRRGKFFPATIKEVRDDLTYEIEYDDGETESRVEESSIRLPGTLDEGKFIEGQKIEANYRNKGRFYRGKIRQVRNDGTFDVDYDDGEYESRVERKNIRSLNGSASPRRQTKFVEGSKVEANYRGRGKYFPARIRRDRDDGTYDVDYDDGETELRVKEEWIRKFDGTVQVRPSQFEEGEKVEGNYRSKGKWYPARIRRKREDGTFDLDYDDGELESHVNSHDIRSREDRAKPSSTSSTKLQEGAKVEANYRGRGKFFPGKIRRDGGDGTFDIDYDDGETELKVKEEYIRLIGGNGIPSTRRTDRLEEGAKVEANYRGRGKYFPGRIRRDRGDGTFDIDYDDGESELRVKEEWIRMKEVAFYEGQKVEANYREKGRFYPAKIKAVRPDGTFDIDYDDGEKESCVSAQNIRSIVDRAAGAVTLAEGDKVEANYRGRGKFFPAKIRRDRGDGTFDIDYDDGESELRVQEEFIRRIDDEAKDKVFNEGAKVDGNYRSRGKWYPAVIKRKREDGTYDLDYDDGEAESYVNSKNIRAREDRNSSRSPSKLEEGAKVEANYRGRGKFFPGKIRRDGGDGTFDVDYDDGETELKVKEEYIRLIGGNGIPSTRRTDRLEEGAKVEANYRGRGKYFPGRIRRDRGDGTFDIDYDDGESELRVKEEWIRLKTVSSSKANAIFLEGMKVEVNYRGRGRYFPATITRVRDDNTFDVKFDDGEEQSEVAEDLLRLIEIQYAEGAKVEANYRGNGRYFPGRVKRDRGDGTYDIDYDDGETELKVHFRFLRYIKVDPRYNIGLVVETDFPYFNEQYRSGKITYLSMKEGWDGVVYNIAFFDGTSEQNVPEAYIRLPRLGAKPPTSSSGTEQQQKENGNSTSFSRPPAGRPTGGNNGHAMNHDSPLKNRRVKESSNSTALGINNDNNNNGNQLQLIRIEGNYHNTNQWLPATIIKENVEEETIDIRYDEINEVETHLPLHRIRLAKPPQSTVPTSSLITSSSERLAIGGGNPTNQLLQLYSLVEVKDYRIGLDGKSTSYGPKWIKGRIISLDYDQELANVRLITTNELLENITFEEIRLLRTSSGNNSRAYSASTVRADPGSNGNGEGLEDAFQLKIILQEKNVEIQQLRNTIQLLEQQAAQCPSSTSANSTFRYSSLLNSTANTNTLSSSSPGSVNGKQLNGNNNSPTTGGGGGGSNGIALLTSDLPADAQYLVGELEALKASQVNDQNKVQSLNEQVTFLNNELFTMKEKEERLLNEIQIIKTNNDELIRKLKEKNLIS